MPELLDREAEGAALDGLLEDLRSGRGRALVVRGEAGVGVGKSALLEYAAGAAADMRVARAAWVESEMELAFASVHLLCAPLLGRLEGLPGPQRDALGVAFGLRADAEHVKLTGAPQPAPWDPELGQVMAAAGRVLFEENVADDLVRDLSGA